MYIDLQVTTNFSFLRGASHADELLRQAQLYGYTQLGITDRNSLAGIVRMHKVAKDNAMRAIIGCRLDLQDGSSLLAYPTDLAAYQRLCRLLTLGNSRVSKGECSLSKTDLYGHARGIKFISVMPRQVDAQFKNDIAEYQEALGRNVYLGAAFAYDGQDSKRLAKLAQLSSKLFMPMVALNDVHYHHSDRRELQDVLTCIRERCTIASAGYRLHPNAERHLKPPQEMARLFRHYPEALRTTLAIAEACCFSLDELFYEYPDEVITAGYTPQQSLEKLIWSHLKDHFDNVVPEKIRQTIEHELKFIQDMNYASYFLTVYDIVRFARTYDGPGGEILCQGRGSAANSAICYYLGITSVDPTKFDLLFERFISADRNEPPDIDVDFEHERREEVIQYIYNKYGRDRAAIVATVNEYRQKGAIRDVGKVMGLSEDAIMRISGSIWQFTREWFEDPQVIAQLKLQGFDLADPTLLKTIQLARELLGFPRHLGQHTGGFVITRDLLSDMCPIFNASMEHRTTIEWNKDDIDDVGMLKIDVLGLGMLTMIKKAFRLAKSTYNYDWTLASIPQDDSDTYDMLQQADSVGVFQVESRAQMSMLPRLKPKCFYDLVVEVAIVRPGPIQGDMVHPYLRRRDGLEPVSYPSKDLEEILGKTLGIPLFQEQAMKIAIVAAGFTPNEADQLRRAMATFKLNGLVSHFEHKLIDGMVRNGYEAEFARKVFRQLEGFGSYGFPESHAASFAQLVYVSSWIKCHHPDIFAAAILNSQPMGFYPASELITDARDHGVDILEVDINHSLWDYTLEASKGYYAALRIGFRQVSGLKQTELERLIDCREQGYISIQDLWRRTRLGLNILKALANADAYRSLGLDSRQALWEISALGAQPTTLFDHLPNEAIMETKVQLPTVTAGEHVINDYASKALSIKAHPVSFLRERLSDQGVATNAALKELRSGQKIKVSGIVMVRQRPGTAGGILFITLRDETSAVNCVIFRKIFEQYRREILAARFMMVEGRLEKKGIVTHVIVTKVHDLSEWLKDITGIKGKNVRPILSRADEIKHGTRGKSIEITAMPEARNFR